MWNLPTNSCKKTQEGLTREKIGLETLFLFIILTAVLRISMNAKLLKTRCEISYRTTRRHEINCKDQFKMDQQTWGNISRTNTQQTRLKLRIQTSSTFLIATKQINVLLASFRSAVYASVVDTLVQSEVSGRSVRFFGHRFSCTKTRL